MKVNKTITLDKEVFEQLGKVMNASILIETLLKEHFARIEASKSSPIIVESNDQDLIMTIDDLEKDAIVIDTDDLKTKRIKNMLGLYAPEFWQKTYKLKSDVATQYSQEYLRYVINCIKSDTEFINPKLWLKSKVNDETEKKILPSV